MVATQLVGCITGTKPVQLSPTYRAQVESATVIIKELERRGRAGEIDPNDYVLAMSTARETLEQILEADAVGQ